MKFLSSQNQETATVSLTPLVDIIFLLIIFFLVSSTFEKGEKHLGIELPQTQGGEASQKSSGPWILMVERSGQWWFNDKPITEKAFEIELRRNLSRKDEIQVQVKADGKVPYERVAKALGLLEKFEFRRVAFATMEAN